ncbi:MAG: Fic family protein [Gemmatimonadetes bacterium]|nr:Fic family protein [Gemmatimonadota bacterium]
MADTAPRDAALAWWQEQIEREKYAGAAEDLPDAAAQRYLRENELLALTPGGWGWVVLGPANPEAESALRQNYWRLVGELLRTYAPAAIDRISAVRLFMGEASTPPLLHVTHASSASERKLEIVPGLSISLRPAPARAEGRIQSERMQVDGVALPVSSPARVLLSLTVTDIRDHRDMVLTWLQSLVLAQPELEAAYERDPRPVLLARIGHLAEAVGNRRLAEQVSRVVNAFHRNRPSRTITGVGRALVIPPYISAQPSLREPWLDRFRAKLARAAEVSAQIVRESGIDLTPAPTRAVLAQARTAKAEDTYHSTTIEGYRITREHVRAVLAGAPLDSPDRAEMERLMALKGYSQAFERTLAFAGAADGGVRLSEPMVLDLYVELWGPSVDAQIMTAAELRGWRQAPVYIRGSAYVPPSSGKVPQMMRVWADSLNDMEVDAVSRAAIAHWAFVHVHPFMDGNGRLSRLLMNLILCGAGLPWTIIRAEERREYFDALEQADIRENYAPFARFVATRVARAQESGS